jgi:hypothetical protein
MVGDDLYEELDEQVLRNAFTGEGK